MDRPRRRRWVVRLTLGGAMLAVAVAAVVLAWVRPLSAREAERIGREFLDRKYPEGSPWSLRRAIPIAADDPSRTLKPIGGGWELWFESGTDAYNEAALLVGEAHRSVVAHGAARAPLHLTPASGPDRGGRAAP